MPEQLSTPNHTRTCASSSCVVRRFTRGASLSLVAFASCAFAYAQNAKQPQPADAPTAAQAAKPGKAKVKAGEGQQKPASAAASAASSSEITRSRRAGTVPAVAPSVAPADAPAAAAAPAVDVRLVSAPKSDATAKSGEKGEEAELDRLRAEIKDASSRTGAERSRLQRALVDALVALKRTDEALDTLRLMIHEDRYDPPFFFNTGNALARLGDASAAEDAYRKAILQRRGNYARALNNLGVILIRQGHWEEARQTLAAALMQENYSYTEASYNLGRLHLLRGEADLAIREWLRTLRLDPAHAEAAAALARAYTEDGNPKRGISVLDNFITRSTRAGASVPREITEARRELFAAAGAKDGGDAAANLKTNAAGGGGGRFAASDARLRAHEVDRVTYDLLQTARARRESGNYEEAVKHYRGVLQRSPGGYFPPANLELGAALINLKRDEEAIAALVPLTQKESARYPVAYYHLGRLYERRGQLALAADSFARAAELYGDANPQVLIDLSRLREQAGDAAGALAAVNAYAASLARQGTVPPWVAERQAKLNRKAMGTGATQSSTAKP